MTSNLIFEGYEYGIDFLTEDRKLIEEYACESEEARDILVDELTSNENHSLWPEDSASLTTWRRKRIRQPIYGLDYGRGSVKARFGGGYVPRSTYQFNGE